MNDETKAKINGWTVKVVVGAFAGLLTFGLMGLIVQGVRDVVAMVYTNDKAIFAVTGEVGVIKQQLAGERITGRFNRIEDRLDKQDVRLQAIEKELARMAGRQQR